MGELAPPAVAAKLPEPAPMGLSLLFAEGTLFNKRLVTSIMEKRGHRVRVAENSSEALRAH